MTYGEARARVQVAWDTKLAELRASYIRRLEERGFSTDAAEHAVDAILHQEDCHDVAERTVEQTTLDVLKIVHGNRVMQ